jgi:iron-sulfur cluster assembly accessory protein
MFIKLTDTAKAYLENVCTREKQKYVHLSVKGGGCAGFSYHWNFTDTPEKNDEVLNIKDDKKLVIDGMSLVHLMGLIIDYRQDIFCSVLQIENPNVKSNCGCGESFNVV